MGSLWESIKKTLKEGATTAAEKAQEFTQIGRIKVEILRIQGRIEKNFTELGGRVYHMIVEENKTRIASDPKVKTFIDEIKALEAQLEEKKRELEEVGKKEEEAKPAEEAVPTEEEKPEGA